jgi:hypothetical protein
MPRRVAPERWAVCAGLLAACVGAAALCVAGEAAGPREAAAAVVAQAGRVLLGGADGKPLEVQSACIAPSPKHEMLA